jgi:hypothetical protein
MRLLKQRRAFTAWIVFTTTVMDKGIQSLFRVKHPTKKDRPRGAAKPPRVTKTRVSESPESPQSIPRLRARASNSQSSRFQWRSQIAEL